jgi:hypothetical protein
VERIVFHDGKLSKGKSRLENKSSIFDPDTLPSCNAVTLTPILVIVQGRVQDSSSREQKRRTLPEALPVNGIVFMSYAVWWMSGKRGGYFFRIESNIFRYKFQEVSR